MKLMTATATALVAALALFGCATDNDGEGGGYLDGLRPAKPSLDDQKSPIIGLNPAIEEILGGLSPHMRGSVQRTVDGGEISAETITTPFPIQGLCKACDIVVLRDPRIPGELNVIDDFGHFVCRIWLSPAGRVETSDCL